MSSTHQQVRSTDDYGAAYSYFQTRAEQAAQEARPGALFEEEDALLECPSTTGGKLYYTAVYTSPGVDLTDPDRPAVVVHVYGSTAQAEQSKGANTTAKPMSYRQARSYAADVRREKRAKGYEFVPLSLVRVGDTAFMAISPMGQLAGVTPPAGFQPDDLYQLSADCFPSDMDKARRVIETAVRYHLLGLRERPRDASVVYGYVRFAPSAAGRWWKVGWICGFGCAVTPAGAVTALTAEEMATEAAALAAALDWDSPSNSAADLRALLGIPPGWADLDLQHAVQCPYNIVDKRALDAEVLIAGALADPPPGPAASVPDVLDAPEEGAPIVSMTKPCREMQRLVTRLLAQHGVDLAYPEAYLKLRLPSKAFMPLCIERIGDTRLSIAHYYVCDPMSGELAADPDVEIFIGSDPWVPLAIQHPSPFGYMVAAELSDDESRIERLNRKAQADLTVFVNQWARNLKEQGFLDRATVEVKKTWPSPAPDPGSATAEDQEAKPGDVELPAGLVSAAHTMTVAGVMEFKARQHGDGICTRSNLLQPDDKDDEEAPDPGNLATTGPGLATTDLTSGPPIQLSLW